MDTSRTGRVTLLDAFTQWQVARASLKDSPHTTAAHRADVLVIGRHLCAADEDPWVTVTLDDLTIPRLRGAFAAFSATHARSSIARAHSTWSSLTRFCTVEGLMAGADPMPAVAKPKVPKSIPKPLSGVGVDGDTQTTAELLVRFLLADERPGRQPWPELDRAVVLTLLLTGVRSSELCDLTVTSLAGPVGERRLSVTGKGGKQRSLPLEEGLEVVLTRYQATRERRFGPARGSDPFFVDVRGRKLTSGQLRYLVRACCRAAGIGDALPQGAVTHSLRHTAATMWAGQGATATELMLLLGHESLVTSQGYIEASVREVRQAAASNPLYRSLP